MSNDVIKQQSDRKSNSILELSECFALLEIKTKPRPSRWLLFMLREWFLRFIRSFLQPIKNPDSCAKEN
jgi:hypothetical protein